MHFVPQGFHRCDILVPHAGRPASSSHDGLAVTISAHRTAAAVHGLPTSQHNWSLHQPRAQQNRTVAGSRLANMPFDFDVAAGKFRPLESAFPTDPHVPRHARLPAKLRHSCHLHLGYVRKPGPQRFPTTSKSAFPLTGSHTVPPRQCTDCHVNNNYNITNTTCISCHQTDFNNAKSPVPHTGFPTTCEQCHDTVQWTDGKFDHSQTGFPLTGSHTVPPRACTDCHVNNNYNLNSTLCITCHQNDFNNAKQSGAAHGLPDDLRASAMTRVPMDGCDLQSQQHRLPADRLAYGAAARVRRLPRQQQLHHRCRRPASVATRPTTTTRKVRCRTRASRRPASSVMTQSNGRMASSITRRPASR